MASRGGWRPRSPIARTCEGIWSSRQSEQLEALKNILAESNAILQHTLLEAQEKLTALEHSKKESEPPTIGSLKWVIHDDYLPTVKQASFTRNPDGSVEKLQGSTKDAAQNYEPEEEDGFCMVEKNEEK